MQQYLYLMQRVLTYGQKKADRTGTGTLSLFGEQLRFDLSKSLPVVTTKKIHLKSIIVELLWFLKGGTNTNYLHEHGVTIWDEWADPEGNLGPIYGKQWRSWGFGPDGKFVDQLDQAIKKLRVNPTSRQILVSAWNVGYIPMMKLPPCHVLFNFYSNNGFLSTHLFMRSADVFLGLPFNITSYAILTNMVARVTNLKPKELVISITDAHIYDNHLDQCYQQIVRRPHSQPTLWLNEHITSIDDYNIDDIRVEDYQYHEPIFAPIAV